MIFDEIQSPTYFLFDNSYAGGSWNGAVIEQALALKKRAETAEAEVKRLTAMIENLASGTLILINETNQLRAAVEACSTYRRHLYHCEDCAEENGCEFVDEFWKIAMDQVDALCGKPHVGEAPPAYPAHGRKEKRMATDGPTPPACNPEIYKDGTLVMMTHSIPSNAMEAWVKQIAEKSGQPVDWHFAGGQACILALGDLARVRGAITDLLPEHDELQRTAWNETLPEVPFRASFMLYAAPEGDISAANP